MTKPLRHCDSFPLVIASRAKQSLVRHYDNCKVGTHGDHRFHECLLYNPVLMNQATLSSMLLNWYKHHARALPWRTTKDPYKIWVSEIMLQQTQVKTVIPYYEKWIRNFPTLKSLAQAPLEKALKYWAGLGYYRRARMLHEGAKHVLTQYQGRVPQDPKELLKIPGIGRYTAGAIASIAFNQRTPLLDGNVIRILTRIYAIRADIGSSKTLERLWKLSASLIPDTAPGDFNQAMMELGATVCFPENPKCGLCPVSSFCKAHKLGKEIHFPVKARKEKLEKIENHALILRDQDKVLIQKQPEKERWGGLWMFPFWTTKAQMLKTTGLKEENLKRCGVIRHGYTKYSISLNIFEWRVPTALKIRNPNVETRNKFEIRNPKSETVQKSSPVLDLKYSNLEFVSDLGFGISSLTRPENTASKQLRCSRWVSTKKLHQYPFPSPHQKIIREFL